MLLHLPDGYTPERPRRLGGHDPNPAAAAGLPDLGPRPGDGWQPRSPSHATSTSSSATRTPPGSAAPTRTPTACSANTSRRAPTCPLHTATSTGSPPNSTTGPAKPSAGKHQPKPSSTYYQTHPSLQRPLESAVCIGSKPCRPSEKYVHVGSDSWERVRGTGIRRRSTDQALGQTPEASNSSSIAWYGARSQPRSATQASS